jgi:hypothetical protein
MKMDAQHYECIGGSAYYPAEWKNCNTQHKKKNALHCESVDVLSNYAVKQTASCTHLNNNGTLHYVKTHVASDSACCLTIYYTICTN